jgi:serine/threonine-protein kinase RsbW/stage II sporulation protein AB (anti-sigma F factor)
MSRTAGARVHAVGPGVATAGATWTLPADPASVAEIRAGVRGFAEAHGIAAAVLDDMALAVSEAATNAVMHAFVGREPGTIRAAVEARAGELVVVVADDGRGMQPRADSPGLGLGLPLIGQLATTLDLRQAGEAGTELCMTFSAPGLQAPIPGGPPTGDEQARLLEEISRTAAGAWPGHGVERLVDLIVPAVADACAVDLIDFEGLPQRFAGRVDGEESAARSAWLAGLRPRIDAAATATRAAMAEGALRIAELTPEHIRAITTSDEDAAQMAATGIRWWVVAPLRDANRVLGLLHFGMRSERGRPTPDVTELLEAVAARAAGGLAGTQLVAELRRARRRFDRVLDVLAEAVTVRDSQGHMVYANPAAARLLGAATTDALLGTSAEEVAARLRMTREDGSPVAPDDLPGSRLLAGLDAPPLLVRTLDPGNGEERWLLIKATRLDDDEPLAVTIAEDVTESRRPAGPA